MQATTSLPILIRRLLAGWGIMIFSLVAADLPATLHTPDGAEMVLIPAGPFLMGSHSGAPEETPPHRRELPAFYLDRTEVTVAQYAAFLAATGHPAPPGWTNGSAPAGTAQLPVTNIRWTDALRYARWAGKRLPTEAEWEKAARGSDGRHYPWGNTDEEAWRNKDSGKLRPVGSFPAGASPSGCLDLSGNAWEWTADWFEPYPGTTARSPHFGRHYKVIRGGGGEYLYGTANTATTFQRARLVPYGAHDFVGFRCAKDPPGQPPPYDVEALLKEADALEKASLPPPRELAYEREFAALNAAGAVPVRIAGAPGQQGLVTMGFPLPRGRVRDAGDLRVLDGTGQPRSLAAEPLASWPDGSLRWVLLRFPGRSEEAVTVKLAPESVCPAPRLAVTLTTNGATFRLANGVLELELDRTNGLRALRRGSGLLVEKFDLSLSLLDPQEPDDPNTLLAGPAETFEIESRSELHADLRWRGPFVDSSNRPGPMSYDLRLRAEAGSAQIRCWLTVWHAQARQPPWEDLKPQVAVSDWRVALWLANPARQWVIGRETGELVLGKATMVALHQPDDLSYRITTGDVELVTGRPAPDRKAASITEATGTRAPGWISAAGEPGSVTLGVRDFWQNHPKALFSFGPLFGVRLWAGDTPMVWEGGLAKTHEFVIELADAPAVPGVAPLLGIVPPAWACGSEAAGALLPRDADALRQLGYWEAWRETAMRQWVNAMPTGLRDYGDAYMGGPYKGKNAYLNLEYDVPLNFLHQFLRTGERWYFEAAAAMARHQADVDTENVAGFAWKHSPQHTTTEAEFGHVFVRGLLLHHLLTGDRRSREIAERLGAWIARELLRGQGIGNERQIGWSLYAVTALHEVTGQPRYLEAARALAGRLAREQAPTGRFNIRWDNRIAFFNGIAASGLLSVNELAPDPTLERAVLRLAERTLGMYPEYAGRTLNAWCWVLGRTGEARFLHNLERTWVSTLEFLLDRDTSTAETHAWRFPAFAARYNLLPQFPDDVGELPRADGWQALRFKSREVELYLRPRESAPVPVVVAREGLGAGQAELCDLTDRVLARVRLGDASRLVESARLSLPAGAPWLRLRLTSPDAFGWQVQHDRRVAVVVADPRGAQLPFLLPRAVGALAEGAKEVTLRFEVMGEGFHSATLFDPQGAPVRRVQRFVDFEDTGRYELELKAPVSGPRAGWALELNAVKVLRIEGFQPYWSARAEDWFNPEQPAAANHQEP
ncbi:MAG: formylglycine-generating enzyme family protein [Verrucomicrobia bacterium]|nr:formylglycine-generating enzyme family protein [Verrucomicrobiota bacterium]